MLICIYTHQVSYLNKTGAYFHGTVQFSPLKEQEHIQKERRMQVQTEMQMREGAKTSTFPTQDAREKKADYTETT